MTKTVYFFVIILIIIVLMHIIETNLEIYDSFEYNENSRGRNEINGRNGINGGNGGNGINSIRKSKQKNHPKDYIKSSKIGLMRGCIMGYILGKDGIDSAILSAGSYAIINPLMLYISG